MREIIIKDTHRGLWYEDGVLKRVLEAGRYELPKGPQRILWFRRYPTIEVTLVDVRERELTIKGQEILTSDKVAIRVSIIVQFRVVDPRAAMHEVEHFEERLYSDVQLAARRSLASMPLEQILTNRNQLSEDILRDVKEIAARYGVSILRADVKDLIFPGNLQEIMNKVLAAERMSEAQLVEARTKAQTAQIDAQAKAEVQQLESQAYVNAQRASAEAAAEVQRIKAHLVTGIRYFQIVNGEPGFMVTIRHTATSEETRQHPDLPWQPCDLLGRWRIEPKWTITQPPWLAERENG